LTLATFLRIGLLLQVGLGALCAWWLLPAGVQWLALPIGLLVPPVGTGLVLGVQFAVGAILDRRIPPLSLRELLAVWWSETWISTRMFSFAQPFAAQFAEPPLVRDPQRPAALLVHGYLCNRAVWRPLLDRGTLADCNIATVNLEPILGSIDRYADVIQAAVEKLREATGASQVALVGHSMGGLAIRAYLRKFGDARINKAITLATPHQGTVFGSLGAGANAKQMAPNARYMKELATSVTPADRAKFVCIATRDDNLIVPRSSPLLPGARHHLLDRVGHLALIADARAWDILRKELHAPAAHGTAAPDQRVIDSAM
jgi:pimeloyl-ACP methyl ester carboxylesterase